MTTDHEVANATDNTLWGNDSTEYRDAIVPQSLVDLYGGATSTKFIRPSIYEIIKTTIHRYWWVILILIGLAEIYGGGR